MPGSMRACPCVADRGVDLAQRSISGSTRHQYIDRGKTRSRRFAAQHFSRQQRVIRRWSPV